MLWNFENNTQKMIKSFHSIRLTYNWLQSKPEMIDIIHKLPIFPLVQNGHKQKSTRFIYMYIFFWGYVFYFWRDVT